MLLKPSSWRPQTLLLKRQSLALLVIRNFISPIEEHAPTAFNGKDELLGCTTNCRNPFSDYLHQLHLPHVSMDSSAFVSLLVQCAHDKSLLLGMLIHSHVVERGLHHITYVANFLLQMYSSCEALSELLTVFIAMHQRNGFSWNLVIRAFARARNSEKALHCFHRMQEESVLPTNITYVSTLDACANERQLDLAHQMHTRIVTIDLGEEIVVWETALVNMYGKCNSLKYADIVFDKMHDKNVVSWTTMISICEQMGRGREARGCFQQMQQEGILPNKHAFVSVIASCAGDVALATGKQAHACLHISRLDKDSVTGSALIDMYGKCDRLAEAEMVFDRLLTRNIIAWTAMIATYSQHGHARLAFSLFEHMQHDSIAPNKATFIGILGACACPEMLDAGKSLHVSIWKQGFECDALVGTALINMYAKCGCLEAAETLFAWLPKCDVVFWNSMIGAYSVLGMVNRAIEMLDLMQMASVIPNKVTFLNLVVAFASDATKLHEGHNLHSCIIEADLESDSAIANALINMYGKCASLHDAQEVFDKVSEQNLFMWSSMICVYANNGFGKKALHMFAKMQEHGVPPDKITLTSVFVACSQAGLLDEAYGFFASMAPDHKFAPMLHHYVCMVDILGKAGRLEDTEVLIKCMPFQPGAIPFTTFLSVCRSRASLELGEEAASSLLELDNVSWVPYLLLAYIHAASGQKVDIGKLSGKLKEKFVEKDLKSVREMANV